MKVVFIGAGNLATNLSREMKARGFEICQVFSRTSDSASALAGQLECGYTTSISEITPDADLYIFSVKDSVLAELLAAMPHSNGLWVHTAGSMPMDVFAPFISRYGVFYPLQTFSKARKADFSDIPFFIEAAQPEDAVMLTEAASTMSSNVIAASSEQRKYLHLAAVFACNFTNHMYDIASQLVEKHNLPFDVLRTLIAETAAKINDMTPHAAQTGPAVRYDENVINRHINLLDDERHKEMYAMISRSIFESSKQ